MSREYRNPIRPADMPSLRKVTANVLTDLGWLHGTFHHCIFVESHKPVRITVTMQGLVAKDGSIRKDATVIRLH